MLSRTHTFATLEVSPSTYKEIEDKLRAADYQQAFGDNAIDMHGLALTRAPLTGEALAEHSAMLTELQQHRAALSRIATKLIGLGVFRPVYEGGADAAWLNIEEALNLPNGVFIIEYLERDEMGVVTRTRRPLAEFPEWAPEWARV